MLTRLDQDIASAGRRSVYTKLWRVDGKLGLATMKSLVHHHFRDNPLVAEYLEGKPRPPEEIECHSQWLEAKAQSLWARRGEHQAMVLDETGIFVFERERVPRADLEILDGGRLKLAVDKTDGGLIDTALAGTLHIRPACLLETSTCTKCDGDYRSCPCSKLLDAGVIQRIKTFKIAFFFWTDRPADNGPAAVVTTSRTD
jgi:hypothetical protein